jgi:glc operon protein GlcG
MTTQGFRQTLAQEQVQALIETGVQAAGKAGVRVSLAVTDDGGHLLGFLRMDGVHTATVDVANAKARCAAAFRRPTRLFAEQLAQGNMALLTIPGLITLPGGLPLTLSDHVVGAVGVSGASPDVDETIATAMRDSLSA